MQRALHVCVPLIKPDLKARLVLFKYILAYAIGAALMQFGVWRSIKPITSVSKQMGPSGEELFCDRKVVLSYGGSLQEVATPR